jgi:hypothetical protein
MQKELVELNEKTKQLFENAFDISEDFNYVDIDQFQSGTIKDSDDSIKQQKFTDLLRKGPVS